jgi:1,4-alpha-glucan branching enzyme
VQDLNRVYQAEPALHEVDFRPEGLLDRLPRQREQCRVNRAPCPQPDDFVVMLFNFHSGAAREYRLACPQRLVRRDPQQRRRALRRQQCRQRRGKQSEAVAAHGFDQSIRLTLPLACLLLKRKR